MPVITLPDKFARLLGGVHLMLNSQQALLGSSFHYIDSSKAMRELGYLHTRADLVEEIRNIISQIIKQSV